MADDVWSYATGERSERVTGLSRQVQSLSEQLRRATECRRAAPGAGARGAEALELERSQRQRTYNSPSNLIKRGFRRTSALKAGAILHSHAAG